MAQLCAVAARGSVVVDEMVLLRRVAGSSARAISAPQTLIGTDRRPCVSSRLEVRLGATRHQPSLKRRYTKSRTDGILGMISVTQTLWFRKDLSIPAGGRLRACSL